MIYQRIKQKSIRFKRKLLEPFWLLEMFPLVFILTLVLIKLVIFTALLPGSWIGQDESIQYLLFYFFRSLFTQTHIFVATLASLMLLFALTPLLRRSQRYVLLVFLNVSITTFALADIVHVRFYADVMSLSELVNVPALKGLLPNIVKNLKSTDCFYYFDIVISFVIFPFYVRACKSIPPLERRYRGRISLALIFFGIILSLPTIWLISQNKNELFSYSSLRIDIASNIGILPYHLSEFFLRLFSAKQNIGETERERVRQFLAEEYNRKKVASPLFGIARGQNVIVISAESLQAFPIGLEVNGQPITPNLNAFAKEGMQFVNYYDQTHLGTTSDAEFMIMQSLHPLPAGVLSSSYHKNYFRAIPKILSEHNYTTVSMCAAPGYFWNMDQMHAHFGFQQSYFDTDYNITERINGWLADDEFFSQSITKLVQIKEPFMAFLLSASNHHPFQLPQKYRELNLGELEGLMIGDYLHSVHYFDKSFGNFIDKLRKNGLLDKTVILVYGDHKANIGDPSEYAKLLGFSEKDEFRSLLNRKKIPLLIRLPYKKEAGIKNKIGGHLDVAPTLLSLLGIIDEKNVMLGTDLTKEVDSMVVFRDGSFINGPNYYVYRTGSTFSMCYEIKTAQAIDCEPLEAQRQKAQERLLISDMIIRGNLIKDYADVKR